jgi:hypothetical protein
MCILHRKGGRVWRRHIRGVGVRWGQGIPNSITHTLVLSVSVSYIDHRPIHNLYQLSPT